MKLQSKILIIGLLSSAPWLSSHAATWNATTDFSSSTTTNPNSVWSYGYDPAAVVGYQLKLFNLFLASSPQIIWRDSTYISSDTPNFTKNVTGSIYAGALPGQISLHPGPAANGDSAILRFTAPQSGLYSVNAQFFAGDTGETDAWVVLNNNFTSPLSSLGVTSTNPIYTATSLSLSSGDTVDFVVGNHGSYFSDTTPLTVQITSVPELSNAVLLFAGLGMLAYRNRNLRRKEA